MALTAPTSSMRAQASCRCLRPVATRSSSTMIMPVTQPNQARIRHVILSGLRLLTGTGGGGLKSVSCQGRRSSFQQQHVVSSTPRRFNVRLTAAASDGDAWGTDNSNSNIPGSNTPSSKAPSSKKPSLCGVQEQQEEGEERQLRAIMKWLFGGVGAMDSATVFLSAYTALPIFPLGGLAGYGAMRNACARAVIAAVPAMSGYTLWRFVAYFTTPYNYLKSKGKGIQALIGMLFAVPLVITLFLCMITPFLALLPLWQFLITIY